MNSGPKPKKTSPFLNNIYSDVAAVITAMTDNERPFLYFTLEAILSDSCIGQVFLCIEEYNNWLDEVISPFLGDARLNILRLPLLPQGAVRNRAVAYVKKPWVAFCDGDDIWCDNKTLVQRNFAEIMNCDFVGADHYLTDEGGDIRAFALSRHIPMLSSWMVRTEIMREHPFNESPECLGIEDGEWWIRTAKKIQKWRCPKALLKYRVRSNSSSSSSTSKKRKAKIIDFSKIPIIGSAVFPLSYIAWVLTRREHYIWLPNWDEWYEKIQEASKINSIY